MPQAPVTILGGLPVIADVWFSRDYYGECYAGVDAIYWRKRDGSAGKEVSKAIYDRLDKIDYWEADVTEQASDWLAYCDHEEEEKVRLK